MTVKEAAKLTGKSERTIRRWAKAGVDLSEKSLRVHSEQCDLAAKGAAHSRALDRLSSAGPVQAAAVVETELAELPEAGEPGAIQALTRLQSLEVRFSQRLEAALDKGNAKQIQAAREDHTRIAESLLKFEREIKESERDLGGLIDRGDAEDAILCAAQWLRLALWNWISAHLPKILAYTDAREATMPVVESFTESILLQMMNARDAKLELPLWAENIIRDQWHLELKKERAE
jgi:hypothetical protein